MTTKVIQIDGSEHAILPNGDIRKVATYYGMDKDVTPNADGSFTINTPDAPNDPDRFVTKNTGRIFVYESSIDSWFEM
jgi:hypothetical protein